MTTNDIFLELAQQLIAVGRFIDSKGWVPATSGNLSVRLPDGSIAITVSGKHKGQLQIDDIMRVNAQGDSFDERVPSAETLLHTALYKRFPSVQAVLHPHSLNATLISRLYPTEVVLENYELLKALPNINTHEARVVVPVFANDQNMPRLVEHIERYMNKHGSVCAYLLAGHGLYTWRNSLTNALRHLEALDFLFTCQLQLQLHGVHS
jgi:methylthioribulose-1-phosphate dehydratase